MSAVTPREIAELAARAYGLCLADLDAGACRKRGLVDRGIAWEARRVAVYLAHRHTSRTWGEIGIVFGLNPDHCGAQMRDNVLWTRARLNNPEFARTIEDIEQQIDDLHDRRTSNHTQELFA